MLGRDRVPRAALGETSRNVFEPAGGAEYGGRGAAARTLGRGVRDTVTAATCSTSRSGSVWDNDAMKPFFC